jgi:hypothetical protein
MKEKLKIVIRNLPETNSSSSHSVVIDGSTVDYNKDYWNFPIDDEGVIHIPDASFGREWDKFNTVLEKTQYACGLICRRTDGEETMKKLEKVKDLIIEFTGAKDVQFDWFPEYYEGIMSQGKDLNGELKYYEEDTFGPEIDHQSVDLYYEVLESEDTLKNFIFNPKSWLFLGSDESDPSEGFYKKEKYVGVIEVNLPGPIGRIDIPINSFPTDISSYFRCEFLEGMTSGKRILNNIYFMSDDLETSKPLTGDINEDDPRCLLYRGIIGENRKGLSKDCRLYWATNELINLVSKRCREIDYKKINFLNWAEEEDKIFKKACEEFPNSIKYIDFRVRTEEFGYVW